MNTDYLQNLQTPGVNVNISNPTLPTPTPTSISQQTIPNLLTSALLQPKHNSPRINDEREIYSIPMGIDSSDFFIHNTKPLVYFVVTDNVGNKISITPFEIKQYVPEPEPTMQDVKAVESRIEERLSTFKNEISDLITNKLEEALK